jgi:hypothetical protein
MPFGARAGVRQDGIGKMFDGNWLPERLIVLVTDGTDWLSWTSTGPPKNKGRLTLRQV